MASYVDASNMINDDLDMEQFDYSTPDSYAESSHSVEPEQTTKKKRKAWGQPVPEINPILPPRKRAKTAEEKEQRKNERILRNRRAADKSRQRQKQEVEALRIRQTETEKENKQLKDILARYQSQFGQLPGVEFQPQLPSNPEPLPQQLPTPASTSLSLDTHLGVDTFNQCPATPAFSPVTSYHDSPVLAPTLNLGEAAMYPSTIDVPGMTQYPAVMLCDPQCQPATSISQLRSLQPGSQLFTVLTTIHYLIMLQTSSAKTLLSQTFRLLMDTLSTIQLEDSITSTNFRLIHILITMPSTTEQKAVFRLKLLSRMLACNPNLALLLEKAADRTLQQLSEQDDWTENASARWAWSTIMTIKWSIRWLESEHNKIRTEMRSGIIDREKWVTSKGVDYGAVEHTAKLWDGLGADEIESCNNSTTTRMDADYRPMNSTQVH